MQATMRQCEVIPTPKETECDLDPNERPHLCDDCHHCRSKPSGSNDVLHESPAKIPLDLRPIAMILDVRDVVARVSKPDTRTDASLSA